MLQAEGMGFTAQSGKWYMSNNLGILLMLKGEGQLCAEAGLQPTLKKGPLLWESGAHGHITFASRLLRTLGSRARILFMTL